MYEHKNQKLLPARRFAGRVAKCFGITAVIVGVALLIGVVGYHAIAGLAWIDAFMNAAMILTGMGPVAPMMSDASKIFASCYGLFSGVIFLSAVGIVLAPIFHRILHLFHVSDSRGE